MRGLEKLIGKEYTFKMSPKLVSTKKVTIRALTAKQAVRKVESRYPEWFICGDFCEAEECHEKGKI